MFNLYTNPFFLKNSENTPGDTDNGGTTVVVTGPDAPPQNPSPLDDEFISSTLNSKWNKSQLINPPHLSNSLVSIDLADGITPFYQYIYQEIPNWNTNADWTFKCKVANNTILGSYDMVGMAILGSNGSAMDIHNMMSDQRWIMDTSRWNTGGNYYDNMTWNWPSPGGFQTYLGIRKNGYRISFMASGDGINYYIMTSISDWRGYFVPDLRYIALGFRPLGAQGPRGVLSVDWFRGEFPVEGS